MPKDDKKQIICGDHIYGVYDLPEHGLQLVTDPKERLPMYGYKFTYCPFCGKKLIEEE